MKSEVRNLIKDLRRQGVEVQVKAHVKCYLEGRHVYTMAKTPSDHRSVKNSVSDLRRMGLLPRKV